MSIASSPIPAGWYPDPAGSFQQRWWTGDSWSNDFAQYRPTLVHSAPAAEGQRAEQPAMANAVVLQQQAVASSAEQASSQQGRSAARTQTMTRQEPASPATTLDSSPAFRLPDDDQPPQTTVAQPNAGKVSLVAVAPGNGIPALDGNVEQQYRPFGFTPEQPQREQSAQPVQPERRYTVSAWLLALLPAALMGAAYAVATIMPALYTTLAVVLMLLLFVAISVALAAVDRRTLRSHGHVSTASPAFALLTPLVFLSVRTAETARETARNTVAPLILLLVVLAGIAAALLFVPGLTSLLLTATALY